MLKRLGIALIVIASILTGCSPGEDGYTPESTPAPETVLSLMLPQTHYKDFFRELLEQFESENSGIRVEPLIIPDNQWIDVVKTKIAINETPDLVRIDKGLLEDVGVENFVEFDSSESWYNRVRPEQLENKMIDGHLYGLPVSSSTSLGVVYNRRIFDSLNLTIPSSYEEFVELCKTLKESGITPLYASDKDSWTTQIGFGSVSVQVTDPKTWEKIKSNQLKWSQVEMFSNILNDLAALRWDGYTNENYMEATYTSAIAEIAHENAAMYIAGQFFISDVKAQNPDIDLMMFPFPYGNDVLTVIDGPGQFSLFKSSPSQEEARVFLNWFSQPKHMDIFTSGWGHMPVFKDQQQPVTEYEQQLLDQYITPGKTVLELDDIMTGVDLNDFWSYQQEMIAGALSAQQVLEKWDQSFSMQMEVKQSPGWK